MEGSSSTQRLTRHQPNPRQNSSAAQRVTKKIAIVRLRFALRHGVQAAEQRQKVIWSDEHSVEQKKKKEGQ